MKNEKLETRVKYPYYLIEIQSIGNPGLLCGTDGVVTQDDKQGAGQIIRFWLLLHSNSSFPGVVLLHYLHFRRPWQSE